MFVPTLPISLFSLPATQREDGGESEPAVLTEALEPVLKILNSQNKKHIGRGILVTHDSFLPFDSVAPEQIARLKFGETIVRSLRSLGYPAEHEVVVHNQGRHMEYFGLLMVREAHNDPDGPCRDNHHVVSRYARDNAGLCVTFRKQPAYLAYLIAKKILEFEIKPEIRKHGIKVDSWFSEKRLYRGPESDLLDFLERRKALRWSNCRLSLKSAAQKGLFDATLVEQNGEPTEAFSAALYAYHALRERSFFAMIPVSPLPGARMFVAPLKICGIDNERIFQTNLSFARDY